MSERQRSVWIEGIELWHNINEHEHLGNGCKSNTNQHARGQTHRCYYFVVWKVRQQKALWDLAWAKVEDNDEKYVYVSQLSQRHTKSHKALGLSFFVAWHNGLTTTRKDHKLRKGAGGNDELNKGHAVSVE